MNDEEVIELVQSLKEDMNNLELWFETNATFRLGMLDKVAELEKENKKLKQKLKVVDVLRAQIDQLLAEGEE